MGGGAWPFLVGGVICLVNSVNERDLILLNSGKDRLLGEGLEWCGGLLLHPLRWILGASINRFLEGQLVSLARGSLRQ